jgi:predicted AlkP superfamily phosphohydrolase/phosphomutase
MKKVVVIGIDGATPDLMEPWMNEGKLPNLDKIRKNGTWGKLHSTIPPFSAPAWTSIVTGCNPGKHGIYGFESTGTLNPHLINSSYRKTPAIWNYLTNIGLKSIVINVPGTYPPEKINGVMITGLLTPSFDSNFTHPKNIKKRLVKEDLGKYELEQFWLEDFSRSRMKKNAPDKLADHINRQMESRLHVGLKLMESMDWDFTMIVFRGTDTSQHFLFDKKELLLSCYKKVDELIGKIMEEFPEVTFFIVSDHGFEKIEKIFYPDNVLYNAYFLTPIQDLYNSSISHFYSLSSKVFNRFLIMLPYKVLRKSKLIKKILFSNASKSKLIDFSKTKAFSTADGRGIQICCKEIDGIVDKSEYKQICDKIILHFRDLKDPEDGKKIIENIYHHTEIYTKNAENPPDLIFDMKKGTTAAEWIRFPNELRNIMQSKRRNIPYIFRHDSAGRTGDHAPYGVFFSYGKGIKSNYKINNISVEDILPNIFTAMDLPLPNNIDGQLGLIFFK